MTKCYKVLQNIEIHLNGKWIMKMGPVSTFCPSDFPDLFEEIKDPKEEPESQEVSGGICKCGVVGMRLPGTCLCPQQTVEKEWDKCELCHERHDPVVHVQLPYFKPQEKEECKHEKSNDWVGNAEELWKRCPDCHICYEREPQPKEKPSTGFKHGPLPSTWIERRIDDALIENWTDQDVAYQRVWAIIDLLDIHSELFAKLSDKE